MYVPCVTSVFWQHLFHFQTSMCEKQWQYASAGMCHFWWLQPGQVYCPGWMQTSPHLSIPPSCALRAALVCSYTVIHHHYAGYATDAISSVSQIQYTRGTNWGNVLNIIQQIEISHKACEKQKHHHIALDWEIQNKYFNKSATKPKWSAFPANKLA